MMARTREEICSTFQHVEVAKNYEKIRGFQKKDYSLLHLSEILIINDVLQGITGPLLELAVGTGRICYSICYRHPIYIALDYSLPMLEEAKSKHKKNLSSLHFIRGDAFSLPFLESSFAGVLSFRFIMMFDIEERKRIYSEIRRILSEGGLLIFDYRTLRPREKQRNEHAFEKLTPSQLQEEIENNGFLLKKIYGNRFGTHHLFPKLLRKTKAINKIISWFDVRILNHFPSLLRKSRSGVVVCEKR